MKISEIIQKTIEYHPSISPDYDGCDGVKIGDTDQECTGIASALVPTVDVIRKTIALRFNLLYVHEPTYYLTPDYADWRADFDCVTQKQKQKLIEDHKIVVYRDHDRMHTHRPDRIFTGVLKYLEWDAFYHEGNQTMPFVFVIEFPEALTVRQINDHLMTKIGMNGTRYIGRADDQIKKAAIIGHLFPGAFIPEKIENGYYTDYSTEIIRCMERGDFEAVIPGEIIEWNLLSYIRDAVSFGQPKACLNIGHFNMEALGAKYAADWLSEITNQQVPVEYVPTGDIWKFQEPYR